MREHIDELLLLFVALIYGFSYSFQSIAAQYVSTFSFVVIKNIIALIVLLVIYAIRKKKSNSFKQSLKIGFIMAIILTAFSSLQQVIAAQNTPGKTAFITSLYIVEVPVINFIFYKKKINLQTLISLVFAIAGLVLLCDLSGFTIKLTDVLTIICSLLLALQIIILGHCDSDLDVIEYNIYTSLFILIFSLIGAFICKEGFDINAYKQAIVPLLYVGVLAAAVCISLQAYAQKTLDETTASLIISLESLFSVFAGYLMLDVALSKKELIGCILMFISIILCVTADKKKKD